MYFTVNVFTYGQVTVTDNKSHTNKVNWNNNHLAYTISSVCAFLERKVVYDFSTEKKEGKKIKTPHRHCRCHHHHQHHYHLHFIVIAASVSDRHLNSSQVKIMRSTKQWTLKLTKQIWFSRECVPFSSVFITL